MNTATLRPTDADQVREALEWAVGGGIALELTGGGSKRGFGRPVAAGTRLDLSALCGVTLYEPAELVLAAGPGTPVAELELELAAQGQHLAFEPPDLGPLYGLPAGQGTLAGALCCNLAGPRRVRAGAARDHVLGIRAVTGRGDAFKGGGRVMKNVTGYDMPKLMAGSFGTLGVLTGITFKLAPAPETVGTLVLCGLDEGRGIQALTRALQSVHEVSGAAHLPAAVAAGSAVAAVASLGTSATVIRCEGFAPSVTARLEGLRTKLAPLGDLVTLPEAPSRALWAEIRDVRPFWADRERAVWRVSVPPAAGRAVAAAVTEALDAERFYDWGGGLVWLSVSAKGDAGAAAVRRAVAACGGNAVLLRAPEPVRAAVPVFDPLPPALAKLTARIKEAFDPGNILNPGRIYG